MKQVLKSPNYTYHSPQIKGHTFSCSSVWFSGCSGYLAALTTVASGGIHKFESNVSAASEADLPVIRLSPADPSVLYDHSNHFWIPQIIWSWRISDTLSDDDTWFDTWALASLPSHAQNKIPKQYINVIKYRPRRDKIKSPPVWNLQRRVGIFSNLLRWALAFLCVIG